MGRWRHNAADPGGDEDEGQEMTAIDDVDVLPSDDEAFTSRCRRRRARRTQRRSRMHRGTQLNIVSLIDVFAVLVFFLLSGASITAGRYQQMELAMPTSSSALVEPPVEQASAPLLLTVTLLQDHIVVADAGGELARFSLSESPEKTDRSLSEMLAGIKASHPQEQSATLRVASNIDYGKIVKVMDLLSRAPDSGAAMFPNISLGDALMAEVTR